MDLTIEQARVLVSNPALWPRVRDLFWNFAPQIHPSWLDGLDTCGLADSPRVKAWLLGQLGVNPCFCDFPKEDRSRLLLLDGNTLVEICKWLGVIACADSLRQIMKGETVRRLKAAFRGVYPEAFGFSVYFKALKIPQSELPEGDQLVDHVLAVGYRILLKVLTPLDEGLLMRFKMKFPKTFADLKPMDVKPSSVNISLLLKLKFPEAHKLCCS